MCRQMIEKLERSNKLFQESILMIETRIAYVNEKINQAATPKKPVTHRTDLLKQNENPKLAEINAVLVKTHNKAAKQRAKLEKLRKRLAEIEVQKGKDVNNLQNQVKEVENEIMQLRNIKKAVEFSMNDGRLLKSIQISNDNANQIEFKCQELREQIKREKQRYRDLDKSIRSEDRAKSEEHRQSILTAHYQMQNLKTTIASIKSNRYQVSSQTPNFTSINVLAKNGLVEPHIQETGENKLRLPQISESQNKSKERAQTLIKSAEGSMLLIKRHMGIIQRKRDQEREYMDEKISEYEKQSKILEQKIKETQKRLEIELNENLPLKQEFDEVKKELVLSMKQVAQMSVSNSQTSMEGQNNGPQDKRKARSKELRVRETSKKLNLIRQSHQQATIVDQSISHEDSYIIRKPPKTTKNRNLSLSNTQNKQSTSNSVILSKNNIGRLIQSQLDNPEKRVVPSFVKSKNKVQRLEIQQINDDRSRTNNLKEENSLVVITDNNIM